MSVVKHSGRGMLRLIVALPLSIMLSALIFYVAGKLGVAILARFDKHSERTKDTIGWALFALPLFWIAVGTVGGAGQVNRQRGYYWELGSNRQTY